MKKNRFKISQKIPLKIHYILIKIYGRIRRMIIFEFNDWEYQKVSGIYSTYDVHREVINFWNEWPDCSWQFGVTPQEIVKIIFLYLKGKILFWRFRIEKFTKNNHHHK